MIYRRPPQDAPIDQGDGIDGCPLVAITEFDPTNPSMPTVEHAIGRVVVLTQTFDLANQKVSQVIVARVLDAAELVAAGQLKASDVRGPIRAARVFGWYFLPKSDELGLGEMIVDLRHLQTIRLEILTALSLSGRRIARVEPLYREHLNKHFADSYSRIGLPEPYETD